MVSSIADEAQMSLAMSHAGKLFDKKNAGSSGGDKTEDKAQGECYFGVCACVLNVMCSDAIGRCDCDAAVWTVPDQRKAGLE